LKDQFFCGNIKLGNGNINYCIVFFDRNSCFDFREFYLAVFKSLNDTSRYFFPSEDLLLSSEVRDDRGIKKPQNKPRPLLSCSGASYPFSPLSQEVGVELLLEQQGCCGFAYKLPLK